MTKKIKIILLSIGLTVVLIVGSVIWFLVIVRDMVTNAEFNHHAYIATCDTILDYMDKKNEIPHSWEDLEKIPGLGEPSESMFAWRKSKSRNIFERRIQVDFSLLGKAATRDEVEKAITYHGGIYPAYGYSDLVLEKLEALRKKKAGESGGGKVTGEHSKSEATGKP